ncbi:MAG: Trk system potassium transporter TrkA [Desulfobacteraceae bacterium]|nr:Trk system potassium transporter TrkA [Desulfobacteraceae bacterium]
MKIIIVGAGEVGYNIANRLASENKRVIVIDKDEKAIKRLSENLDVQTVTASGSNPGVLIEAGIKKADILLAVTDSDEVNLVACLMTNLISPETKKLARVRNSDFDPYHNSLKKDHPQIDTLINPETEVVNTIRKLMKVPGAVDVGNFVDGQVKYVGIRVHSDSPMAGMELIDFPARFGEDSPLIAAIIRENKVIVPRGSDKIIHRDLIYFVCETRKLEKNLERFGIRKQPIRNVLIVGGGRIGERLAKSLEDDAIKVKIIESDISRCEYLSIQMKKTVILHGDGSDQKLFLEENAGQSDAVICVTNDDETNILVSLLAKNLGVKNTITRIGKTSYFPLLPTIGIEKVVSPRLSAISSILQDVRKGKVLSDISIFCEKGEFIEAIAIEASMIINKPLKKIKFPNGSLLVCIIRDMQIIIPSGASKIKSGDRIILFAIKAAIKKLEKMLTVKLGFF